MSELVTVYSAEVMRRLRSRIFWIGLLLGAAGVAGLIKFPAFIESYSAQAEQIVVSGDSGLVARVKPLLAKDYPIVRSMPPANANLRIERAARGLRVTIYAKNPANLSVTTIRRDLLPLNLELATSMRAPAIRSLIQIPIEVRPAGSKFGNAAQADDARTIAYILLTFLYVLIVVNSQLIMSSVAEEKTSRIAELLVASVDPRVLLAGKIAASGTLAILQMVVWVGIALLIGSHSGMPGATGLSAQGTGTQFSLTSVSAGDVVAFVLFFLLAYIQMATLFAAVGSLVNRTEDLGSLSGPLFIPVIAAFLIAMSALAVPESPAVIVTSFIPIVAPFVMFARIVVSNVPLWQIALSFWINVSATVAIGILGGKIYRVGMLMYGRAPKLSQIFHVLRT